MPSPVVPASPSMNTLGLLPCHFPGSRNEKPRRMRTGGVWLLAERVLVNADLPNPVADRTPIPRPSRRYGGIVVVMRASRNHGAEARSRCRGRQ